MTTNASLPAKPEVMSQLELLVKWGSVLLGSLFMIGLLVSNGQLISLGISDFSALDTRNIMIGVLFIYYLGLLVVTIIPIVGSINLFMVEIHKTRQCRWQGEKDWYFHTLFIVRYSSDRSYDAS